MVERRLALVCLISAGFACSSKPPPKSPPPATGTTLVSPDTGPSALQRRLAAMKPAAALPPSGAQRRLDQALADYHRRVQSHRAYIAVDKPLYRPGETIWFRAFDLVSADLEGPQQNYGTSFQLVSPRGSVVMQKRVLTSGGAAANDFPLPAGLAGGEYTIKASTDQGAEVERSVVVSSYQPPRIKKKLEFLRKAYGPGDKVAAAVALHRATGEALAAHAATGLVSLDGAELSRVKVTTDAKGNATVRFDLPETIARGDGLLTVLVTDGGVTESIQKRIPITLDKIQLAMYPEGGDLVRGLPGRVYFSAKNSIDKPADIEGRVLDDKGRLVAKLRSYHNGMGRFELTPRPGRSYRVEITRPAGIEKSFPVPAARPKGCSMQAVDDFRSERKDLRVAVWCSRAQKVVATAVLRESRLGTVSAQVGGGEPTILSLPAPKRAQGAVRVTLLDTDLAPLAERLLYRNRTVDLDVEITADEKSYNPRDPVVLTVKTRGPDGEPVAADLALSVVDDTVLSFADDKTANLLARLYLESEMPGQEIEEPNFYFSDDPKAPASIDLVLGTQGWRRFDWKLVFREPEPIQDDWDFDDDDFWGAAEGKKVAEEEKAEEAAPVDKDRDEVRDLADRPLPDRPVPAKAPAARPVAAAKPMPMADEAAPMAGAAVEMDARMEAIPLRRRAGFRGGDFEIGGERLNKKLEIRAKNIEGGRRDLGRFAWAPVRQFPVPSYRGDYDGPRVDFRDTIYWAPRVKTGEDGTTQVSFFVSDAVTSFRAIAEGVGEGGVLGRGEALVTSKLPVSLAVKMPLEVSAGDRIQLPVTVSNETDEPRTANLEATFGPAFKRTGAEIPNRVKLGAGERRSFFYGLEVVGDGDAEDDGKVLVAVSSAHLRDQVERTIKVAPLGFPQEISISGTVKDKETHPLVISDVLPGTMNAKLTMYPSPLATMVEGTESMIREPTGCFEQASSANYPNVMILSYLEEHGAADPALIARTSGMLDRGYQKLTGYESPHKGYEWFGGDPGHEALTAYGLMEFLDMSAVYQDVDRSMVERTSRWLKGRRDGKGGYKRNQRALDSFGRAGEEVTDAYITYALTEARTRGIKKEVARQAEVARETKDPYVLALAANTLLNRKDGAAKSAVKRLAAMQDEDGSFAGAKESITRSGGVALQIETTSLAALALMKADGHMAQVRRAVEWLNGHRDGFGGYGSTQSTVLALKAMSTYAEKSRKTRSAGVATVSIDGEKAGRLAYEAGHEGALEIDLRDHVHPGKSEVEIGLDSDDPLPYSMLITYGSTVPPSSDEAKVSIETDLKKSRVPMGEGVKMKVRVKNVTRKGIPMVLARVGIPGGLTYQTWQLKELKKKKLIDFYETREREVILYFRSMAPEADKTIDLELKAEVPGTYTAPASSAYLYYTDEDKSWAAPAKVTVVR